MRRYRAVIRDMSAHTRWAATIEAPGPAEARVLALREFYKPFDVDAAVAKCAHLGATAIDMIRSAAARDEAFRAECRRGLFGMNVIRCK